MKRKNRNLKTLEQFKEKYYGKRGSKKREVLEAGYKKFIVEIAKQLNSNSK